MVWTLRDRVTGRYVCKFHALSRAPFYVDPEDDGGFGLYAKKVEYASLSTARRVATSMSAYRTRKGVPTNLEVVEVV